MYSMDNEEKYVFAERFIKTLKNNIYKYMTSVSKIVHIDKLDKILINWYHSTIKRKSVAVKSDKYMKLNKNNEVDPKFKVVDHVRISKFKNILAKFYTPNWSDEVFAIKKVKKYSGMDVCSRKILMVKKCLERFMKSGYKKQIK